MQVAFFSNCDCDSVTVATRFFTFLPFYPFTFSMKTQSTFCGNYIEPYLRIQKKVYRLWLTDTLFACFRKIDEKQIYFF